MNTSNPNNETATNSPDALPRIEPRSPRSSDHPLPSDGRGIKGEGMSNGEGRGKQPTPTLDQKISRLPKPTRDMINLMLDDGLPYKVIIDELAQSGRGLTPQSLIQWLQSGYADYLKHRDEIEAVKTRAEFAADFLRELGDIDVTTIHRACLLLASLQIFNAIDEHGEKALREMLQIKPASYCTLLNSLCTTVKPVIALEKHCVASESNAK